MISLFVCRNSLKLILGLLICLGSLGWAQSSNTQALQRYSLAVFNFEVTSVIEAYSQNLGEIMADFFGTPLVNSGRFKVIDRAELEKIIDELGLGEAGIVNPDQAKQFGEVAGVDIIIMGNIAILAPDHYRITARFTNVLTSEIAEQQALRASGPEEFLEVASEFVELAKARFPSSFPTLHAMKPLH